MFVPEVRGGDARDDSNIVQLSSLSAQVSAALSEAGGFWGLASFCVDRRLEL
jgi:hypothetical protein